MKLRVLVALFSGLTSFITMCLAPFAYFGDKNESWAMRLAIICFVAGIVFLVAVFW